MAQLVKEFKQAPKGELKDLLRIYQYYWYETLKQPDIEVANKVISLAKNAGNDTVITYAAMMEDRMRLLQLTDSVEIRPFLQQMLAKYDACPWPALTALFYAQLSRNYKDANKPEKALFYAIKSTNAIDKAGWKNVPLSGLLASHFFWLYLNFEDVKTALYFAQNAVTYADTIFCNPGQPGRCKVSTFDLNNLGVLYLKNNDYIQASTIFMQCYDQAAAQKDSVYMGITIGNYGNTLRLQGQYQKALPYLYREVSFNGSNSNIDYNTMISYIYLADCMVHTDSVEKARQFFYASWDKLHGAAPVTDFRLKWYEAKIEYFKKILDYKQVSLYQDSLVHLKDSLKSIYNSKALVQASIQNQTEKYDLEKTTLQQEARNTRNLIIAGLVLLFAAIFFWLRQKNITVIKKAKQREEATAAQLEAANQQLTQYITNLKEKQALLDKISQQMVDAAGKTNSADPKLAIQLEVLQQTAILTEEDWDRFKALFEKTHVGFIDRLTASYPLLNPAEIRLLVLMQLNITSKEMASMLGISAASLRTARYRLRKKYPELMEGAGEE